jgi:hypothetical protein
LSEQGAFDYGPILGLKPDENVRLSDPQNSYNATLLACYPACLQVRAVIRLMAKGGLLHHEFAILIRHLSFLNGGYHGRQFGGR